ncbi:MAG: DNA-directed RNA polymerase subunit alpha [Patescibacteria group bacterium]
MMDKFLLPSTFKIEETDKSNVVQVVIEPCYFGYGTTLGNALRRVLLSSLPGAAVTAVKIKGAPHEFGALEHVKEDVVEIILNLKKLRLRVFSQEEEVRLVLEARGEGEVTAAQIEATSDVEIVNSDLRIATLTDPKAKLEMEIFVSQGRGYVPVEEKDRKKLELGCIAVDSIFTPVLNVGYKVDFVRVGETTNYERLTLTIETDGTITPVSALNQSTQILLDHFNLILEGYGGKAEQPVLAAISQDEANIVPEEIKEAVIEEKEEKTENKAVKKPAKKGRPKKTK